MQVGRVLGGGVVRFFEEAIQMGVFRVFSVA
jgi:hypothetical protein